MQNSIPYREYSALVELMEAHRKEFSRALRAMVAFGEIMDPRDNYDIDLLEVIEGWEGRLLHTFTNTASLPLRGSLRIYFFTPEQFEDPGRIEDTDDRAWARGTLERVRAGYDVIFEQPAGYARRILSGDGTSVPSALAGPPTSGAVASLDPLRPLRTRR